MKGRFNHFLEKLAEANDETFGPKGPSCGGSQKGSDGQSADQVTFMEHGDQHAPDSAGSGLEGPAKPNA